MSGQVQAMIAAAVDQYGRLDILFNNVGIPTPRLGMTVRGPHVWTISTGWSR